jgi:transposase
MDRFCLTDAQWAKMAPHCLGKPTDPGRTGMDGRLFLEAVLWIARTGALWRDLPLIFGKWNPLPMDAETYSWRHLIENFFCKLKEFKRIAMRSDKTDTSFAAMIYLCSALINSR